MLMGRQFGDADRYVDYANLDSRYDFLPSSTLRHSSDRKLTHFARCLRGCRSGSEVEQERRDEASVFWLLEGYPDWRQGRSALAEAAVPLVIRGDPFVCTLSPCCSKTCQSTGVRMRSRYHLVFLVITRYRRNLPHFCIKCDVMEMQKLVHTATSARRLAIAAASGTLSGWGVSCRGLEEHPDIFHLNCPSVPQRPNRACWSAPLTTPHQASVVQLLFGGHKTCKHKPTTSSNTPLPPLKPCKPTPSTSILSSVGRFTSTALPTIVASV